MTRVTVNPQFILSVHGASKTVLYWANLKTIAMVQRERHLDDEASNETSYYISSHENSAEKIAQAIRGHWGIENSLHWTLDVSFHEDQCRVWKDHAPENLAVIRHIALNLLKKRKHSKEAYSPNALKLAGTMII